MLHFKDEFETEDYKVIRHCIGSFGVNTYIIICKKTHKAAVIDPGGEVDARVECLRSHDAQVDWMLFTHAHIDHIAGAQGLADGVSIGHVAYHRADDIVVEHIPDMCKMFGVPVVPMPRRTDDLAESAEFSVGGLQVRTIATPGHTPGGVCFYIAEHGLCFTGDTLFKGSVGRTDFEGGDGHALRQSLDLLLSILGDDVKILPGHGKYSTMGAERASNFYLKIDKYR